MEQILRVVFLDPERPHPVSFFFFLILSICCYLQFVWQPFILWYFLVYAFFFTFLSLFIFHGSHSWYFHIMECIIRNDTALLPSIHPPKKGDESTCVWMTTYGCLFYFSFQTNFEGSRKTQAPISWCWCCTWGTQETSRRCGSKDNWGRTCNWWMGEFVLDQATI